MNDDVFENEENLGAAVPIGSKKDWEFKFNYTKINLPK
jgi:hypothetical protein